MNLRSAESALRGVAMLMAYTYGAMDVLCRRTNVESQRHRGVESHYRCVNVEPCMYDVEF